MTRTFDLLNLRRSGHQGIERLFGRAHHYAWDLERDVDWTTPFAEDDPLVAFGWAPYSRTAAFEALPEAARVRFTRRALSWTLNSLHLGESVALEVCLKLAQLSRLDDHRNHAVAQAMDEARHHLAYARMLEKLAEPAEDIDRGTRAMFDGVLALEEIVDLVAWEQFYLESIAMNVLRSVRDHAVNPLVKDVFAYNLRDESRHMGFGVMFIEQHLRELPVDERIAFARRWLDQILPLNFGGQDPVTLQRLTRWLYDAGVDDCLARAGEMMAQQSVIVAAEYAAVISGERVPQELRSARRAGLMAPEILEELRLQDHPFIRGTLHGAADLPDDNA